MWAVRKVSIHFEYLENQLHGLDVNLAASQRWPYCGSMNSHCPVGLVSWQWDAVDWACVLCVTVTFTMTERADQLHHDNVPAHSTALMQTFSGKASHHPGLSTPLQPRFGSLRLLAFPKAKIAIERGEICECDSHTVHKLSQQCLTANCLAPRESDCL
jgi:hypothetical protein